MVADEQPPRAAQGCSPDHPISTAEPAVVRSICTSAACADLRATCEASAAPLPSFRALDQDWCFGRPHGTPCHFARPIVYHRRRAKAECGAQYGPFGIVWAPQK